MCLCTCERLCVCVSVAVSMMCVIILVSVSGPVCCPQEEGSWAQTLSLACLRGGGVPWGLSDIIVLLAWHGGWQRQAQRPSAGTHLPLGHSGPS